MVTFEDLEMTTLKKIIRLYNSHIKIPYTRKKVKLTQQELIEEMKKHLVIENNIVKLKADNYSINVDDILPKKKEPKAKKAKKAKKEDEVITKEVKKEFKEIFKNTKQEKPVKEDKKYKDYLENVYEKEFLGNYDDSTLNEKIEKLNKLLNKYKDNKKYIEYLNKELADSEKTRKDRIDDVKEQFEKLIKMPLTKLKSQDDLMNAVFSLVKLLDYNNAYNIGLKFEDVPEVIVDFVHKNPEIRGAYQLNQVLKKKEKPKKNKEIIKSEEKPKTKQEIKQEKLNQFSKISIKKLKGYKDDKLVKGALELFKMSPDLQIIIYDKEKDLYNKFVKAYIDYLHKTVKKSEEETKKMIEELEKSDKPEDKKLLKYYEKKDHNSIIAEKIMDLSRYTQNRIIEVEPKLAQIKGVNVKPYVKAPPKPKKEKVVKEKVKKPRKPRVKKLKFHQNEDGEDRPDGPLSDEDAEEKAYEINDEIEEIMDDKELSDEEVDQKIAELIDSQTPQIKWYLKEMFNKE